jgi:hypothetical protein
MSTTLPYPRAESLSIGILDRTRQYEAGRECIQDDSSDSALECTMIFFWFIGSLALRGLACWSWMEAVSKQASKQASKQVGPGGSLRTIRIIIATTTRSADRLTHEQDIISTRSRRSALIS